MTKLDFHHFQVRQFNNIFEQSWCRCRVGATPARRSNCLQTRRIHHQVKYRRLNANTCIVAAILFSGHPYIGRHYRATLIDGISITNGYPRRHVWSFIAGFQENFGSSNCLCSTGSAPPSAVGNNYFCESGCSGNINKNVFYSNDRLWDGEQCGVIERGCCAASGLPWFHKTLSSPTSDYIELRICCDQGTSDEDVAVGLYEIYTK